MNYRLLIPAFFLLLALTSASCNKNVNSEFPKDPEGAVVDVDSIRIVTYNIHGGGGPGGEGTLEGNLLAFIDLLTGEHIVCLQEVPPAVWDIVKNLFPDYEYRYFVPQLTTVNIRKKKGGNAILSKLPMLYYEDQLIQTDPGGDEWERKAQYVQIQVGSQYQVLHLFHYHNTYNWHINESQAEKEGIKKFQNYIMDNISSGNLAVAIGDFNIHLPYALQIIPNDPFEYHVSFWVDHIFATGKLAGQGRYPTYGLKLSDHDAVWGVVCNGDCD